MPKKKQIDEDLQTALKDIVKKCEDEDEFLRRAQIKTWKKYEEFWHGVQYLFWNEKSQTWISPSSGAAPNLGFSDEEMEELGPFYDFVIDICTAHGESIISALSSKLPSIRFLPDDSASDDDVDTAKTYDKIAELIERHNNSKLKFLQSLFFLWINGFVASYHYVDTDKKYGVYKVPVFEDQEIEQSTCPECGAALGGDDEGNLNSGMPKENESVADNGESLADESAAPQNEEESEESPEEEKVETPQEEQEEQVVCPECQNEVTPTKSKVKVPIYTHDEEKPKSRVLSTVYGGLFVKVPFYAFDQSGCGYLGLYLDKPKDELVSAFCYDNGKYDEELARKIESEYMINDDRYARNEYQYPTGPEQENKSMTTLIQYWLRPSKFNLHEDHEVRQKLIKRFPKGCKVVFVGKTKAFILAEEEELDRRWTVGKGKLSTYIHGDPLCRPLVPIQEMRNQLDNLIMDTIEHGIPSEFADSEILDFDAYGKFEATPGMMFKAKARPGQRIADGFYTQQKAQVPREVGTYRAALDKDAQFVVGSFPSLYGGPTEGKSRTLGEYTQSRQQALQRLSLVWIHVSDYYRRDTEQMVRMFAEIMVEDEHFTERQNNNYLTTWIRKSQMKGKIGGVESEASDTFPMSAQQKQAFITKFIELNNPQINAALFSPENRQVLQEIFMLDELKMPGANQIYKQVCEINQMLQGNGPIAPGISSVPIDPLVDDDAIHIAAVKDFMVDSQGLDIKRQSPLIYADLAAHLMMHQKNLQLKTAMQFEQTGAGEQPDTAETSEAGGDQ